MQGVRRDGDVGGGGKLLTKADLFGKDLWELGVYMMDALRPMIGKGRWFDYWVDGTL